MIDRRFLLVLACFFLSGLAGLIYQTAWTRQFALVFGTSELALVTVLAAYMAGLALGAAAAGRWARRLRRPVLAYAVLELGIGAAALLVPAAIDLASRLHVALFGGAETPPAASVASAFFYLGSSFAILLVPTALMGATLPLLARWAVRSEAEIAPRVGALYTANTAGAAAGTLAAAFLLLPRLGLGRTVLAAAAVNVAVFLLATVLARGTGAPIGEDPEAGRHPRPAPARRGGGWILPLILLSGAVSFTWEILWTRLLSQLLGGSVYAFATMLATFLAGIALGSLVAAKLAPDPERARSGFAAAQLAAAGCSLAAFALSDRLPALAGPAAGGGEILARGAALAALTLLPAAVAIGATFPFAVRVLAEGAAGAAEASARVFAWNTAGAIAGALAAGYLALPALRFAGTAAAAAALSLALAAAAALAARPRRLILAGAAGAGMALLALAPPSPPWSMLRRSPLTAEIAGDVVYFGVGRSATVLLTGTRRGWRLSTNGLPESGVEPPWGRPGRYAVARWLSLLPLAARPETRSLLVVGLGAGVTVEDVPASVEEIHVAELEPEVIRANRRVADRRWRDPLADPRLRLHEGDARGVLKLTGRRFDAIVSQPSHPWTSGASHLFTREFFALVRERLAPAGVFVQWMGLPFVDDALLRSLVATAGDVFAHVELYQPRPGALLVLASSEPLDLAATAPPAIASAREPWSRLGILVADDVRAARVLDAAGSRRFGAGADLVTDSRNLFQTRSPAVLRHPLSAAGADSLLAPHDPLIAEATGENALYLVRRLIRAGGVRRARRLAEALDEPAARLTGVGLTDLAIGRRRPAEAALRRALEIDPGSGEARHALLGAYRVMIGRGRPVPIAQGLTEDPAAAVVDGWRLDGAGDWRGVRRLERRLAAVDPRHSLYAAAVRLRAGWRADSGDPGLAGEALALLEPLLAPVPSAVDLVLRADAAAAAGAPRIALAELGEAWPQLARRPDLIDEARRILEVIPAGSELGSWRSELLSRFAKKPVLTTTY